MQSKTGLTSTISGRRIKLYFTFSIVLWRAIFEWGTVSRAYYWSVKFPRNTYVSPQWFTMHAHQIHQGVRRTLCKAVRGFQTFQALRRCVRQGLKSELFDASNHRCCKCPDQLEGYDCEQPPTKSIFTCYHLAKNGSNEALKRRLEPSFLQSINPHYKVSKLSWPEKLWSPIQRKLWLRICQTEALVQCTQITVSYHHQLNTSEFTTTSLIGSSKNTTWNGSTSEQFDGDKCFKYFPKQETRSFYFELAPQELLSAYRGHFAKS